MPRVAAGKLRCRPGQPNAPAVLADRGSVARAECACQMCRMDADRVRQLGEPRAVTRTQHLLCTAKPRLRPAGVELGSRLAARRGQQLQSKALGGQWRSGVRRAELTGKAPGEPAQAAPAKLNEPVETIADRVATHRGAERSRSGHPRLRTGRRARLRPASSPRRPDRAASFGRETISRDCPRGRTRGTATRGRRRPERIRAGTEAPRA